MNISTGVTSQHFQPHASRLFVLLSLIALTLVPAAACRRDLDPQSAAVVRRGTLTMVLTVAGTLRPIEALTYRSPVVGRELEIVHLVSEGTRVRQGEVIAALDTTELQREVDRLAQELRQLQGDLQLAHGDRQDAEAAVQNVTEGQGALTVDEARSALQLAQKKADRLRQEYARLQPLLAQGFITRDQVDRSADTLEEADEELAMARRRADVLVTLTHPRDTHRRALELAQKKSRLEDLVGRVEEAEIRLLRMRAQVESCRIVARHPGLVVYESLLSANPTRKIRVGDRVTATQRLVTIPEVNRMFVEATVGEAEVHRVKTGQAATVRLEGLPDRLLTGTVIRVGALTTSVLQPALVGRRFDVTIELDGTDDQLRPEMTARADILTSQRNDVLLMPVTAVFDTGGTIAAHLERRSGIETRPIELGESNEQFVEVLAGLAENDRVIVR